MPKTPLRALRVPDELWRAAQARARESGETVSGVVRRALVDYVSGPGHPTSAGGDPAAATLATLPDNRFLLAQGMVMQRRGLDAEEAAAYLRETADAEGRTVDETVAAFLADRPTPQLGAAQLGAAQLGPARLG